MKTDFDFIEDVSVKINKDGAILVYDKSGNHLYFKNSYGDEEQHEYDENNNKTHSKKSDGYEYWHTYDNNNSLIHYKNSDGDEEWYNSERKIITKKSLIPSTIHDILHTTSSKDKV